MSGRWESWASQLKKKLQVTSTTVTVNFSVRHDPMAVRILPMARPDYLCRAVANPHHLCPGDGASCYDLPRASVYFSYKQKDTTYTSQVGFNKSVDFYVVL